MSGRARHCLLAAILSMLAMASPRAEDAYPARPITMIVPFAAGGSTDVIARIVAEGLRRVLGQSVTVDNRGGAGGSLGTAAIAKAPADGSTIGMGTLSTLAINPAAYKKLPYDVLIDLVPIGAIAVVPNIMAINPGLPASNMAEFLAVAKARSARLSYGSPGYGSVAHLLGEQFKLATGVDLVHVPYRGMGPALNDAVGGQIEVIFDNLPTTLPLVLDGRLRALGVSGAKRVAALPDVPTFGELGLDAINGMAFFGLVAPGGTPPAMIVHLNAALAEVLAMPDVRERLTGQMATVAGGSPEAFRAQIVRELAGMRRAVVAAKIELQ